MPADKVELTAAEWIVIKAVWAKEPCTAPEIQADLNAETKWSYSTVRTIMDRMVAKGLLKSKKEGKITMFHSAVTQKQAQRSELLYTLKNAFNGALTPMLQCLLDTESLSRDELAEIESMIAKKKSAKK